MYYILYSIYASSIKNKLKRTKLVPSLKCQTLNIQATYESSISCFNGKWPRKQKISFKKLIGVQGLRK